MEAVHTHPDTENGHAVRRALRFSVMDGACYAIMMGTAESYLGALAVELGHGPTHQALLTTVPILSGALCQLAAVPLARAVGGRKSLVVLGAAIQAAAVLIFLGLAVSHTTALWPFST